MFTGLHGIDIITPGASRVDYVQDNEFCKFAGLQEILNTASINAFYVWTVIPPNARFRIEYVIVDFTTLGMA